MKAEEFDRKFDAGEDISLLLDLSKVKRPRRQKQHIQVDLPANKNLTKLKLTI